MKRYRIIKKVMLNFCGAQDNYDLFIDPVGDVFLETDGTTIWLLKDDKRHETNNMPGYINLLLERKSIEEQPWKVQPTRDSRE